MFVEILERRAAGAGPEAPSDLHVTEMLPDPDGLWIADETGRYATEFLVHLQGADLASPSRAHRDTGKVW